MRIAPHILFTKNIKREHRGKYIVVKNGKIVATGKNAKEAYRLAKKVIPKARIEGIYYIPQREELLTALCVFRTSK